MKSTCLYIYLDRNHNWSGVFQKAKSQCKALNYIFITKFLYLQSQNRIGRFLESITILPIKIIKNILIFKNVHIYYRYSSTFFLFNILLFLIHRYIKLYVEINSKIRDELKLTHYIFLLFNNMGEKLIYNSADLVLAITPEIAHYVKNIDPNCKVKVIYNGYDPPDDINNDVHLKKVGLQEILRKCEAKKKFIWVGTPAPWHGLEKILQIIHQIDNACLFLVGDIIKIKQLNIPSELINSEKIYLLGKKSPHEIRILYSYCDFAFGAFGLEIKNMTEACPLKVREYLYYGLPVIIGSKDPQLDHLPFIHRYNNIYDLNKFIDYNFDKKIISNYAKNNLSWKIIFQYIFNSKH